MKVLALSIAVLLLISAPITFARVIGSDYSDDIVAVYHFNAETEGFVRDYGENAVIGVLLDDASLTDGKYGQCLSLAETTHKFAGLDTNAYLGSLNEFSTVAWIKIPSQDDDFYLTAAALEPGPLGSLTTIGVAQLVVKTDGNLKGVYADVEDSNGLDIETTDQTVNDDTWHHIAFTVSDSQMKLYLDGESIAEVEVTGYTGFVADYTFISIGKAAKGLVDDAGFFVDTFSDANIKFIHDAGLENIISIASVDPKDKMATTWGAIKSQR
jgi:hypothetical protein